MKEKIQIWFNANWFKIGLLVLLAIIIGSAFYWYEWRPSIIKKNCYKEAAEGARDLLKTKAEMPGGEEYKEGAKRGLFLREDYEKKYEYCLRKYGL